MGSRPSRFSQSTKRQFHFTLFTDIRPTVAELAAAGCRLRWAAIVGENALRQE